MSNKDQNKIILTYTKAVVHLNYAFNNNTKLGLILGAGISNELKIPSWKKLLDEVATHIRFDGKNQSASEPYRAEQLFQYFRVEHLKKLDLDKREIAEAAVCSEWRKIVSKILYKEFLKNGEIDGRLFERAVNRHPYIRDLARIAGKLELVITHNFDNALEYAIETEPTIGRPENRRRNTFWRPDPFLRQNMVNIYHPNGFIPIGDTKASDSIILTEANFADHLANSNTIESNFVINHLSNKTWLLIGHSLSDGTLKNALRLHAIRRPGHVNYFIHWLPSTGPQLTDKEKTAIREANFSTYNLVTLFLKSKEIKSLLALISMSGDDLQNVLSQASLPSKYVYYICGAVSSGKSTILSHLRNIITVEEWPDKMPSTMNKPSTDLAINQEDEIDRKLENAIWEKNKEINDIKVGLVAVDRGPLDFIAFPKDENELPQSVAKKRHGKVLKRLQLNNFKDLCEGQVIVVSASPETLLERQIHRGRKPSDEDLKSKRTLRYLERQQDIIHQIYKEPIDEKSGVKGDCCSIAVCLQDVIRIIHFSDYKPFDVSARLNKYLTEA